MFPSPTHRIFIPPWYPCGAAAVPRASARVRALSLRFLHADRFDGVVAPSLALGRVAARFRSASDSGSPRIFAIARVMRASRPFFAIARRSTRARRARASARRARAAARRGVGAGRRSARRGAEWRARRTTRRATTPARRRAKRAPATRWRELATWASLAGDRGGERGDDDDERR